MYSETHERARTHTDAHRCPRTERALLLIHLTFMTAQHMDKPNMLGSPVPGLSVVADIFQKKQFEILLHLQPGQEIFFMHKTWSNLKQPRESNKAGEHSGEGTRRNRNVSHPIFNFQFSRKLWNMEVVSRNWSLSDSLLFLSSPLASRKKRDDL